jgi:hypothetical protein
MDCRQVKEELIAGQEPSPRARQHLDGCDECREFYADIQAIRSAYGTSVQTPASLRQRTLASCRDLLAERAAAAESSLWRRCRRVVDSPRFVAAAAILSVAVVISVIGFQLDDIQDEAISLPIKLTITLGVAQNVFTALFMPALLMFNRRSVVIRPRAVKSGA